MENNDEMKAQAAAAVANGQKLRVAVTKTSAQGQAAQAASPNLMSFSSDENSVWFNGKKYGALHLKRVENLSASSTSSEIAAVIGDATEANFSAIVNFIGKAGLVVVQDTWHEYVASSNYNSNVDSNRYILVEYLKSSDKLVKRSLNFKFSGSAWSLEVSTTEVTPANVDKFYSSLGDSVQVPSTVGGIKAGTTAAQLKGKKQNEIIDMLLFPEQQPTVANPSASIALKNAFKANGIYEVGSAGPVQADFTTGFNRGTCTVAGQAAKNRAGALDSSKSFIYVGGSTSNKTFPAKVTLGTMQYNYVATYGQGDTLLTSWGNKASVTPNPLPAGSVNSGAIYIYGTYPYYCNGASASTSAQDTNFPSAAAPDTKLPLQKWTDTLVGAKFASEASTGRRLVFEFPVTKQVTKVEFMNTVSGKWEVFAEGNYAVSSSRNKNIQGSYIMYNELTTKGAFNGTLQLRFTLANASARMMADDGLDDDIIEAVLKAPAGEAVDGGTVALSADVAGDGIMPVSEDGIMPAAVDTGNRAQGVAAFAVNFEPGGQAPLDARTLVPTKADLVNAKTYAAKNYYKGMTVVVEDTQEVYVLKDVSKVSSSDYSGWKRIDAGAAAKTPVVDNLDSTSTTSALSANQGRVLKGLVDGKLAKSDVVNSLSDTSTTKALSAAQGKALNDKFNGNKININFSATSNSTDNATIKGYMGNIDGATLVNKLTYGANLVDSSSEDWVITLQEVSATKVSFTGIKFAGFNLYSKNISVTISGSNYTNMTAAQGSRFVPAINNTLTSTSTSEALSAAQGKALNDRINGLGSPYKVKGTKTNISDVLAFTDAKVGDVWNVTNEFMMQGKKYPAGTNVVCVTATSSLAHDDRNWDALGGTVDLTPYLTESDASNTYAKKADTDTSFEEIWEQLGVVVAKDEIVNNLTSSETNKPLSAAMGKKLQDEKLSKTDANNTYLTKENAESTYAKKADGISHYSIGELTALSSNPTQEQLKTALGTPSAFRNAIDAGKLILVTGKANVQSQKSATCIIDSGNVIVKYLHPGNNDWTVIAKCVPASSGDNWDNAQFSVRIVKPSDSAGITIE